MKQLTITFLLFFYLSAENLLAEDTHSAYEKYNSSFLDKKHKFFSLYQENYLLFYAMPAKLSLSFKINVTHFINATTDTGLYMAYSHLSLLQLLQSSKDYTSNPTVDNNYMPEVFFLFSPRDHIPWFSIQTGFKHESNGQGAWEAYKSVSWNQLYIEPQLHFVIGDGYLTTNTRFFIPSDISENPHILDYLGFTEIYLNYKTIIKKTVGIGVNVMMRKGLRSNYGSFQLGLSIGPFFYDSFMFPLSFYIEYFTGYGESLLLYNIKYSKIRVGISFPIL